MPWKSAYSTVMHVLLLSFADERRVLLAGVLRPHCHWSKLSLTACYRYWSCRPKVADGGIDSC